MTPLPQDLLQRDQLDHSLSLQSEGQGMMQASSMYPVTSHITMDKQQTEYTTTSFYYFPQASVSLRISRMFTLISTTDTGKMHIDSPIYFFCFVLFMAFIFSVILEGGSWNVVFYPQKWALSCKKFENPCFKVVKEIMERSRELIQLEHM